MQTIETDFADFLRGPPVWSQDEAKLFGLRETGANLLINQFSVEWIGITE